MWRRSMAWFSSVNQTFIERVQKSKARKDKAALWLRYYFGQQSPDLLALISAKWSKPEQFRLFEINIVRKICDKRAMVYLQKPRRTFGGFDQARGEALYRAMRADLVLKKANRLTKLHKTTALQVGWSEVGPTLAVVTPNILDVLADDPWFPTEIIVTRPGERADQTTYSHWTADSFTRRDSRGAPLPLADNPGAVNPYGVLPFVPCFDRDPDDAFFLPGGEDLIEAQQAVNVALVNLWRAIELQSHGQAWATGVPVSEALAVGPDRAVTLPDGGSFGFASPGTPIEEVLLAVEFLIKQTAVAHDLATNVFELSPKAESGAAKVTENRDLLEARQDDLELWRSYEGRLFEVLKRVVNIHRPGTIPEGATLSVDFGEITEDLSERERLDGYQRRLDLGVWSPVDVLLADNPDLCSRDQAIVELQRRQEEMALFAPALPGLGFQMGA
ncbi:conserved hypothetical protein [Azospirillaceae bacterium]